MWIEAIVCNEKSPTNERMYDFIITYYCTLHMFMNAELWLLSIEWVA